jgi:hypothetical protein
MNSTRTRVAVATALAAAAAPMISTAAVPVVATVTGVDAGTTTDAEAASEATVTESTTTTSVAPEPELEPTADPLACQVPVDGEAATEVDPAPADPTCEPTIADDTSTTVPTEPTVPTDPATTEPTVPTDPTVPADPTVPTDTTVPVPTDTTVPAPDGEVTETTVVDAPAPEPVVEEPAPAKDVSDPIDLAPAPEPVRTFDPGLSASAYDGVYAQGVPVWIAMATSRQLESGGNYLAQARLASASGAYQIVDRTWNGYAGYARAVHAPPAVQDQFAYESMVAILKRYGNDVSMIPVAWYYPAAIRNPELMDVVPMPEAGNRLTPREYQALWLTLYASQLSEGAPVFLPSDTEPLIPSIAFPVLGPVEFWHDWHQPRDGGERQHEGIDIMGVAGQPLRAAFDGTVVRVRQANQGIAGVAITVARDDGVYANYFHLNDDTPGTHDGVADGSLRIHPGLGVGTRVRAGQIIGYMGDTGNAGIPHLHFELRTPERQPIDPYPAILEAQQREQCSVGIGPWATQFASPAAMAEMVPMLTPEAVAALAELANLEPYTIEGPDGAVWTVGRDGSVTANGVGALITPEQGECDVVPTVPYGTESAGFALDLLPATWWDAPTDETGLVAGPVFDDGDAFEGDASPVVVEPLPLVVGPK